MRSMEHNTFFKLIYTCILGVVIALFLGVGVQAFYEAPKAPDYPITTMEYKVDRTDEDARLESQRQAKFEQESKEYNERREVYERNVSVILIVLAVVTIATGVLLSSRIGFLSDGILLGGLFTLVHALIRGFGAGDTKYLFVAAAVSVAVILYLGYRRFTHSPTPQITKSKK